MKNIQVITKYFYPVRGGIEDSILESYSRLAKHGYEVTVHTSMDDHGAKDAFGPAGAAEGIKIKRYKSAWFGFWPALDWDRSDFINLHNFNIFPHVLIMLFAWWRKLVSKRACRLVLHPHGGFTPRWSDFSGPAGAIKAAYHRGPGKWLLNLACDRVRAVSDFEKEVLSARGIRPAIAVIPNGIADPGPVAALSGAMMATKAKVDKLGRYLVQVGKVIPAKNHRIVIKALKSAPPDLKYLIVGEKSDPAYAAELKSLAQESGLADRVFFTGRIEEEKKRYLISRALAFVNLDAAESYGSAVREAMAAGAITIVSRGTALEVLADKGERGIALDPNSEKQLAEAVNFIANNRNSFALELMRKKARAAAGEDSYEAVAAGLDRLFSEAGPPAEAPKDTKAPEPPAGRKRHKAAVLAGGLIMLAVFGILLLSLRGLAGNPDEAALLSEEWTVNGPLESSNERGRYALLYSIVEHRSLILSEALADFSTPDLARNQVGGYVSLFPPGMAFALIPGYLAGRALGLAQVGVYVQIALVAALNVLLIYLIARRLDCGRAPAWLAALAFIFATPAFAYAVSYSQHHFSLCLILMGAYSLLRWPGIRAMAVVFLLCGFSLIIDSANFFNLLPLGIFAFLSIIQVSRPDGGIKIKTKPGLLPVVLVILLPLGLYLLYNQAAHGDPLQLSGTLPRVTELAESAGRSPDDLASLNTQEDSAEDKQALGFFRTRNLLNGFYIHFLSPDRGLLNYAPITLLGIFGFFALARRNRYAFNLLLSLIAANLLLYSMWGDPYGGWSFGSRYLIPTYAFLSIGIALLLSHCRWKGLCLLLFFLVFLSSAAVNTVGALSSSLNPPRIEVLSLEEITGVEQKFTVDRNWQYLEEKGTKSFAYAVFFDKYLSPRGYYNLVYGLVVSLALAISLGYYFFWRRRNVTRNYNI